MFVQVIEGRVNDQDGLKAQLDKWHKEQAPSATGWLGSTGGFTDDGSFIGVIRFESQEAAQANSERPEQGAWWQETSGFLDGEATFLNCPDVDEFGAGGSDDAGFVQIMQGRADRDRVRAEMPALEEPLRRMRQDVIGGFAAWPGDGTFTQVIYFTNEEEARKGEQAQPAPEDVEAMSKLDGLMQVDRYIDLRNPWLRSPA